MSEFQRDMNWTSGLFEQSVWPSISDFCGGGEIVTMEVNVDRLADYFDKYAGVDVWQVTPCGQMRGLASRVQRVSAEMRPYNSFTVRARRFNGAKTEHAKRKAAIESTRGALYPYLTIQAYVTEDNNELMSAGVCKTADLFDYIDAGHSSENETTNASFYTCFWSDMMKAGYKVRIFQNHQLQLTISGKNYSTTK